MQAVASLQHEAPRHASHAAMPVPNGSTQDTPEPLLAPVCVLLPIVTDVLAPRVPPPGPPHSGAQATSTQPTRPVKALSDAHAPGGPDERQAMQLASPSQVVACEQQAAPMHASHAAIPVRKGREHAGPEPLAALVSEAELSPADSEATLLSCAVLALSRLVAVPPALDARDPTTLAVDAPVAAPAPLAGAELDASTALDAPPRAALSPGLDAVDADRKGLMTNAIEDWPLRVAVVAPPSPRPGVGLSSTAPEQPATVIARPASVTRTPSNLGFMGSVRCEGAATHSRRRSRFPAACRALLPHESPAKTSHLRHLVQSFGCILSMATLHHEQPGGCTMTAHSPTPERIEKKVLLRAPRERVWRAVSDAKEFGSWFGVAFDAPFSPGARMTGRIVPTTVDPTVARTQEPYAGAAFEITIERIEPLSLFSFRWHPFAIDEGVDYSKEPTTLVVFELSDAPGGTLLTVTESGFDGIPVERRAKAFGANDGGWSAQMGLIAKYLDRAGAT